MITEKYPNGLEQVVVQHPNNRITYLQNKLYKYSEKLRKSVFDYVIIDPDGDTAGEDTEFLHVLNEWVTSYNDNIQVQPVPTFLGVIDEMIIEIKEHSFIREDEIFWLIYKIVDMSDIVFPYKPTLVSDLTEQIKLNKYIDYGKSKTKKN